MEDFVILVDDQDKEWGKMEKIQAHQMGLLHRAFSVFVFNSKGELLLQKRSPEKYHSGGLWTNTCCSHPRIGEEVSEGAIRRLEEEMGITCELTNGFQFVYKASFDNGLTEHEYDHVLFGQSDQQPRVDSSEVSDWRYASIEEIESEIQSNSGAYTVWFITCFDRVKNYYLKTKNL